MSFILLLMVGALPIGYLARLFVWHLGEGELLKMEHHLSYWEHNVLGSSGVCVPWLLSSHPSSLHSHIAQPSSSGYTLSWKLTGLNVCGSHETLLLVLMSKTSPLFFPCHLGFSSGM